MSLNKIMAISPYLEVIIRKVYWRIPWVVEYYNKKLKVKKNEDPQISSKILIEQLSQCGIQKGDLIVLHSSFKSLRANKESPNQIIDSILDLIGKSGTLSMPAIPLFTGGPDISERMTADMDDIVLDYDPKTTPVWTGALPISLMSYAGAVRSLHPLNSMVAIGPMATPMMEGNIAGVNPLPCGINSSWHYCYKNNAKVVAIGTDLAHSLTMIHVAEDMLGDKWVVPNWYRKRKFNIKINQKYAIFTVLERHPKWAQHYAERTLSKDLIKNKSTKKRSIKGVNLEIIDSKNLVDYLSSRNKTGYPYYFVPIKK